MSEGFAPAVLFIDIKGKQQAQENKENKKQEENKIAEQFKAKHLRNVGEQTVIESKEKHEDASAEPESGIFKRHFLAPDEFEDKKKNDDGNQNGERFCRHGKLRLVVSF